MISTGHSRFPQIIFSSLCNGLNHSISVGSNYCPFLTWHACTCCGTHNHLLRTASLSGGWVPGMSKGFHFWQPAPILNNAPMAGTTLQPAMSPHAQETKTGTRHTEKNSGKKREGGRARWRMLSATLADRNSTHCQTYATWVKHCTVAHALKMTSDRGYCWRSLLLTPLNCI